MEKEPFDNDKIDLFLKGELSEEESNDIRARMEADEDFKKEVLLHEQVIKGLQNEGGAILREDLESIYQENFQNTNAQPTQFPYKIAATIAFLLAAGFAIFFILKDDQEIETFTKKVIVDESSLGFTNGEEIDDSVTFAIMGSDNSAMEYKFLNDTLYLNTYEPLSEEEVSIEFIPKENYYRLELGGEVYELHKGFNYFMPLEKPD